MHVQLRPNKQTNGGAEPGVGLQDLKKWSDDPRKTQGSILFLYLRRLFFDDKGALDEAVEEQVEAVAELRENVHAVLLAGDVEALLDHLQLPDLLLVQPNYFSKIFTPGER